METQKEFVYQYDFDENGALFFLGSKGNSRLWNNPHCIGEVEAFGSSIGQGRIEEIVGRKLTKTRTHNEAFSYFGVDLKNRKLLPSAYTLKNRDSVSHILLNWMFEGSNDKINWTCLDKRVYLTGDPQHDAQFESDRRELSKRGATSTWGINTDIYKQIGVEGF